MLNNITIRQALRAGIICALSVFVEQTWIKADSPGWIVFTAFVCTQANVGSSLRKTKQRLLGTCTGCLLAFIITYFHPNNHIVLVFLFLLCITIAMYYITSYAYAMFFATFSVLILYMLLYPGGVHFIILRIKDVGIGALFGVLGTLLLWPDYARKKFNNDIQDVTIQIKNLFISIDNWLQGKHTSADVSKQKEASAQSTQYARERLLEIGHEVKRNKFPFKEYEAFIRSQERIHYVLLTIFNTLKTNSTQKDKQSHNPLIQSEYTRLQEIYTNILEKINSPKVDIHTIFTPKNEIPFAQEDIKEKHLLERLYCDLKTMDVVVDNILNWKKLG